MISKKYLKDYKVELSLTQNGKWKDAAIYIGPNYQLNLTGKELAVRIMQQILLNALGWCLFFLPLFVYSSITRTIYIILPYMFLFLVCLYQSSAVYRLCLLKRPCKREEKDKVVERLKGSALSGIIICSITAISSVIYTIVVTKSNNMGNLLFICSDMIFMIAFILHLRLAKKMTFSEYLPLK